MLLPELCRTQYEKNTIRQVTDSTLALSDIAKRTTRQNGNKHTRIY